MRSNTTLHLQKNAHLIASRNPEDYMNFINDKISSISKEDKTNVLWKPVKERTTSDHINKPASRWNNAVIKAIDAVGSKIVLRCPIIPNVNDTEEHFLGIANVANSLKNILSIDVEPYHSLGSSKYKKIGQSEAEQSFKTPNNQQVKEWIMQIQKHAKVVVKKRSKSIIKISINLLKIQIITTQFVN